MQYSFSRTNLRLFNDLTTLKVRLIYRIYFFLVYIHQVSPVSGPCCNIQYAIISPGVFFFCSFPDFPSSEVLLAACVVKGSEVFSFHRTEEHDFPPKHQTGSRAATRKTAPCTQSDSTGSQSWDGSTSELQRSACGNSCAKKKEKKKKLEVKCLPNAPDGKLVRSPKTWFGFIPNYKD